MVPVLLRRNPGCFDWLVDGGSNELERTKDPIW